MPHCPTEALNRCNRLVTARSLGEPLQAQPACCEDCWLACTQCSASLPLPPADLAALWRLHNHSCYVLAKNFWKLDGDGREVLQSRAGGRSGQCCVQEKLGDCWHTQPHWAILEAKIKIHRHLWCILCAQTVQWGPKCQLFAGAVPRHPTWRNFLGGSNWAAAWTQEGVSTT